MAAWRPPAPCWKRLSARLGLLLVRADARADCPAPRRSGGTNVRHLNSPQSAGKFGPFPGM
eukprot:1183950-Alexandrium_andersonii.AAC.1